MSKMYKWGIIGPGKIAEKFAAALSNIPNAVLHGVASRDIARAGQFAEKYNAAKWYGSYEALAGDGEIDVVYIATPHTFHHAHALLCLENKKPVLCEKPLSVNYDSTLEIVTAARKNNTFLMEAMWTRFLPIIDKTLELIRSGEIGEIKHIRADFGFNLPFDAESRLYNVQLGGGSLLDVGVYPLFLCLLLLGKPDEIKSFAHLSATGADETTNALLYYKNGAMASIHSSIAMQTPITADISGTKGVISLAIPWYKGTEVVLQKNGSITGSFLVPYAGNGFEFEIVEVMNCLENGLTESKLMPADFSLLMSGVVNEICNQCNIRYQVEA
jgi:predicted dehydrogenase